MKVLKVLGIAYGAWLGFHVFTNLVTRPVARAVTAKAGVPQLANLI